MPIQQPSNQIRLTNVSLVRMKKGRTRYEIACYKNKVLEWRNGVEKDLDNVLQIPAVFVNVGKGQMASALELASSFGDEMSSDQIILEILNKGELQVGEKERQAQLDRVHNEVIDIVAGKLVDPRTKRVYTHGMIEKALAELSTRSAQSSSHHHHHHRHEAGKPASSAPSSGTATPSNNNTSDQGGATTAAPPADHGKGKPRELPGWTGVVTTRSAKSQALDAMKALIAHQPIPVARARMRLRITCPTSLLKQSTRSSAQQSQPQQQPQPSHNESKKKKNKNKSQGNASKPKDPQPEEDEESLEAKAKTTVKDRITSYIEEIESQEVLGQDWEVVGFVEPGAYKGLTEFIGAESKGRARVEVLDMAVVHEDQY